MNNSIKTTTLAVAMWAAVSTWAVADAKTQNQVNSILDNSPKATLDNNYLMDSKKDNLYLNLNEGNNSYWANVEFVNNSTVVWLEYKKVWDVFGTLATLRVGKENKSFFLTWVYDWVDFSAKATLGWARINWVNQSFIWAEVKRAISKSLAVSAYANGTHTWDATLSVTEVERVVKWWKEFISRVERFEWYNTNSFGVWVEYFPTERNKLAVNWGRKNMWGESGYTYWVDASHLTSDNKTEFSVSYNDNKTSN